MIDNILLAELVVFQLITILIVLHLKWLERDLLSEIKRLERQICKKKK